MPDFLLTDSLKNPVDIGKVDWTSGSSLFTYLKSELLHLIVAPDFEKLKDKSLSEAAPDPLTFDLSVGHSFELGDTKPEVDVRPGAEVILSVNATAGSDLFNGDNFHVPSVVSRQTAYVGLSITGSLDLGVSGSSGDLTFGIDQNQSATLQYLKAFQTSQDEPSLGAATAAMLSGFVIPVSIADLARLGVNDVCSVSGQGCLTISAGVTVTMPVNPLASLNLPLGMGTVAVQDGVMAGLSASLALSGSYQIRLERLTSGSIRLSYLKERGTAFESHLTASAGVSIDIGTTDLLAKFLGAIGTDAVDPAMLEGLSADEISAFTSAISAGVDHSVKASVDLALSSESDTQTAFQYEIQSELLDVNSTKALERALKGDLSLLTVLEKTAQADGTIAPGIKLLNSVLSTARTRGCLLKVNLIGIVNLISMAKLIDNCEFLFEPASGDLTIRETSQSERIGAITDPLKKQQALRKAMFDSVLATTTYVVSKAITMPALSCESVHFANSSNTRRQDIADYTNWFVALNLMSPDERAGFVSRFEEGGASTCTMRTRLDDARCEVLFFDGEGKLRLPSEYLEIGREALKALLDPQNSDVDRSRYRFLDDPATWARAVEMGPSPELGTLLSLSSADPRFNVVLADVSGDLYDIVWWADAMHKAGQALNDIRTFLSGRDPISLADDPAFAKHRNGLQKLMLGVVASSKVRFNEPWGMVCLFQAAGARGSEGQLRARGLTIDRAGAVPVVARAGHSTL